MATRVVCDDFGTLEPVYVTASEEWYEAHIVCSLDAGGAVDDSVVLKVLIGHGTIRLLLWQPEDTGDPVELMLVDDIAAWKARHEE